MSFHLRMTPEQLEAYTTRTKTHVKLESRKTEAQVAATAVQRAGVDSGKPYKGPKRVRAPKKRKIPESTVLEACGLILESHPKVGLWWRNNSGVGRFGDRWVKFSFKGASDLFFILVGGRFGACETKATGEVPSEDQAGFIANVNAAGGFAMWCDDPDVLKTALDAI